MWPAEGGGARACNGHVTAVQRPCNGRATAVQRPCNGRLERRSIGPRPSQMYQLAHSNQRSGEDGPLDALTCSASTIGDFLSAIASR